MIEPKIILNGLGTRDVVGFVMYEQNSFQDVLGEHIRRAPYLVASLFVHFAIALMIAGIMILQSKEDDAPPLIVAAPPPPAPEVEDPIEPIIPEKIPEPTEDPVVIETAEVVAEQPLQDLGDPEQDADSPFDAFADNGDIGLGGPPGGKFGLRGGQPGGGGPSAADDAVSHGLKWLADHQSPEGFWDADGFMFSDIYDDKPPSTGTGNPVNDVGLSGLALLALQGNGNTQASGKFKRNVGDGVNWMRQVQRDDGLFGEPAGNSTLYNHAIATMAMGEAYYFSNKSLVLKPTMKKAVQIIHRARNDYGAWRYDLDANGDNDSSITGWMVFALKTAEENDLPVDHSAYGGAESWFASMEDKNTGRTGYTWGNGGGGVGSGPSRLPEYLEKFPADRSEALTAVALLSRIFMTDGDRVKRWKDHPQYELLRKQADLLVSKPPRWDEHDGSIDMYYWYYGTYAMNQWGGSHWKEWKKSIEKALLPNQRREDPEDNFYGSWDPAGPWGTEGGRVYSTALCTLILQVYYRYTNVLGAR